jgi:polar amino acid transport system permease protein
MIHKLTSQQKRWWVDTVLFLLSGWCLIWIIIRGSERLGYHWQWYRVPKYLLYFSDGSWNSGLLINGLWVTLEITAASLLLAFFIGLCAAICRGSISIIGQLLSRGYVELIRNTPLLVQIFFIYFVLAPALGLGRFFSAILALSLFEGAYISEILRAGIQSIDRGQWEASYSCGLTPMQTYRHIILPQAVRRMLPPLTGQAVSLIKDSALVSTIAIYDLTMQGQAIVSETFLTFEIWFTIAVMYLFMTFTLSTVVQVLEKRTSFTR